MLYEAVLVSAVQQSESANVFIVSLPVGSPCPPQFPGLHTHFTTSVPRLKKGSKLSPLWATVRGFKPRPLCHFAAGDSRAHEIEATLMAKIRVHKSLPS